MIYKLILILYNVIFSISLPFIVIKKLIRSRNNIGYRKRLLERFGISPFKLDSSIIIHSVSVGESIAVAPLVKNLAAQYPDEKFIVTTMTPTGSEQVLKIYEKVNNVYHCYLPYDISIFLRIFFALNKPKLFIAMETELWPNLLSCCSSKNVPFILTNARLSNKSYLGYAKVKFVINRMLKDITHISAQSSDDAENFISLGYDKHKISITGNLKYDFVLPEKLDELAKQITRNVRNTPIWIAASTHQGEEELILEAHRLVHKKHNNSILIIVPRHPERFNQVHKLILDKGFTCTRRSNDKLITNDDVYLADSMGELMVLYNTCDIAFVGGSFSKTGGHNMLEPAALSKAILSGLSTFNFTQIVQQMLGNNAIVITKTHIELAENVIRLIDDQDLRNTMGSNALQCFNSNQGSLNKQLNNIKKYIDEY